MRWLIPIKPRRRRSRIILWQSKNALVDTHKAAQKEVKDNIAAIEKCNGDTAEKLSTEIAESKKEVGTRREAHKKCRDGEIKIWQEKEKKCKHLTSWLKQTTADGPEKPAGYEQVPDDEKVEYVEKMSAYWCKKGDVAQEKQRVCEKLKKDHLAEKEKCDPLQSQFELGFCSWRTKLIDACEEHTTCYDDAKKAYTVHKKQTEELVLKWKTEYTALKKILCYVNVWLSDDKAETVDSSQLKHCQKLTPDDSKMDVDYGKVPAKAECSLADVQVHPGTENFKPTEYEHYLDFVNEPSSCLEEEATTTEAPTSTTEAPTTTTEANHCARATGAGLQKECASMQGNWIPKIKGSFATVCDAKVVLTKGKTCKFWCESKGLTCVRAQDNVHNECKLDGRHNRQSQSGEGCNQKWNNQVCQCGKA